MSRKISCAGQEKRTNFTPTSHSLSQRMALERGPRRRKERKETSTTVFSKCGCCAFQFLRWDKQLHAKLMPDIICLIVKTIPSRKFWPGALNTWLFRKGTQRGGGKKRVVSRGSSGEKGWLTLTIFYTEGGPRGGEGEEARRELEARTTAISINSVHEPCVMDRADMECLSSSSSSSSYRVPYRNLLFYSGLFPPLEGKVRK